MGLEKYKNLKICVALSGGRDSMALLHYLKTHAKEYSIFVSALNCDHKMRKNSSSDSQFVKDYCKQNGVPLLTFEWNCEGKKSEGSARKWRHECYLKAATPKTLADGTEWAGADAIATAHHMNDNAETVLFNLSRGSALSGLTGISDDRTLFEGVRIISPLIAVSRQEIDEYIAENAIPYVDDETNFKSDYTRNKIRLKVLPELEKAVPGALSAIHRFSRLAADDEEYFAKLIADRRLINATPLGTEIARCEEKVIFKRAALRVLSGLNVKDYTSEHLQALFELQFADKGKRFEFLNLVAFKEEKKIVLLPAAELECDTVYSFAAYLKEGLTDFCGQTLGFYKEGAAPLPNAKVLKFDLDKIPDGAQIRTARRGDRFKKFAGGTKSLGDFFTDKKIPVRLRGRIPLVANGSEILMVCGVEISDAVRVESSTERVALCTAENYVKN